MTLDREPPGQPYCHAGRDSTHLGDYMIISRSAVVLLVAFGILGTTASASASVSASPAPEELTEPPYELRYDVVESEKDLADSLHYTEDGTVVVQMDDQELRLTQDGGWTIGDPQPETDVSARAAYPIALCTGNFANMQLTYRELFWGGSQTCDSRNYPHYIRVRLLSRSGFPNPFSIDFNYQRSSSSLDYVRVTNRYFDPRCTTLSRTQYQQQVIPASRGTEFPSIRDSDAPFFNCRF